MTDLPAPKASKSSGQTPTPSTRDRSIAAVVWYRIVQCLFAVLLSVFYGLRATGRKNIPKSGSAIMVSNHLSHLDSFVLGILLTRPLNYVARSTLFVSLLGVYIRSVGGFPIQRDGLGASGMKETLRRLRAGGIVILYPEGTRTHDGEIAEIKPGISVMASRARTPVIPVAIAGSFESWPRTALAPRPHPVRVHFGRPIDPSELAGLDPEAATQLIRNRMLDSQRIARRGLASDLGVPANSGGIAVGDDPAFE